MGKYLRKAQAKLNKRITARDAAVSTMPNGRGWQKASEDWNKAYRKPGSMKLSKN